MKYWLLLLFVMSFVSTYLQAQSLKKGLASVTLNQVAIIKIGLEKEVSRGNFEKAKLQAWKNS